MPILSREHLLLLNISVQENQVYDPRPVVGGWVGVMVIKTRLGIPVSHVGVPGFESQLCFLPRFLLMHTMGGRKPKDLGPCHRHGQHKWSS